MSAVACHLHPPKPLHYEDHDRWEMSCDTGDTMAQFDDLNDLTQESYTCQQRREGSRPTREPDRQRQRQTLQNF